MEQNKLIDDVLAAQQAVAEAEQKVKLAITARAETVRAALDEGIGAQPVADALGVRRHRVYQMRDQGDAGQDKKPAP